LERTKEGSFGLSKIVLSVIQKIPVGT